LKLAPKASAKADKDKAADKPVKATGGIKAVKDEPSDKDPTDPTTPGNNGGRPALRRIK
jgi:hypothetical protein